MESAGRHLVTAVERPDRDFIPAMKGSGGHFISTERRRNEGLADGLPGTGEIKVNGHGQTPIHCGASSPTAAGPRMRPESQSDGKQIGLVDSYASGWDILRLEQIFSLLPLEGITAGAHRNKRGRICAAVLAPQGRSLTCHAAFFAVQKQSFEMLGERRLNDCLNRLAAVERARANAAWQTRRGPTPARLWRLTLRMDAPTAEERSQLAECPRLRGWADRLAKALGQPKLENGDLAISKTEVALDLLPAELRQSGGGRLTRAVANALLKQAQAGNKAAFVELAVRAERLFYTVAYRILGDPGLADDARQEALILIWKNLPKFDSSNNGYSWVMKILRNSAFTVQRRRGAVTKHENGTIDDSVHDESAANVRAGIDPAVVLITQERRQEVRIAIDQLTAEERDLLLDRYVNGRTSRRMAEKLEIPTGTLGSRLHKAKRSLKRVLKNDGG